MFKAMVIIDGVKKTESFEHLGSAIKWMRSWLFATEFAIYYPNGDLYCGE